jgi:hypothetical protein
MIANMILMIALSLVAVRTASFGVWTWKRRNRLGAVMVFVVAVAAVALPAYTLFIREA